MSFEGYYQRLCKNGHYHIQDALTAMYCGDETVCSVCHEPFIWENLVDQTNGSFDLDGVTQIDGYINLEIKKQTKCKECGHTLEVIYKVPKRRK
jgi:hypothetical protein